MNSQGTQNDLPITVSQGPIFSLGSQPFLSYADPVVYSVSGCPRSVPLSGGPPRGNTTLDCARAGGTRITLQGAQFGPRDAKVVVGGASCVNVQHDAASPHTRLTCVLPAGSAPSAVLLVVQDFGTANQQQQEPGERVNIGYLQCAPGYFAADEQIVCQPCPLGMPSVGLAPLPMRLLDSSSALVQARTLRTAASRPVCSALRAVPPPARKAASLRAPSALPARSRHKRCAP